MFIVQRKYIRYIVLSVCMNLERRFCGGDWVPKKICVLCQFRNITNRMPQIKCVLLYLNHRRIMHAIFCDLTCMQQLYTIAQHYLPGNFPIFVRVFICVVVVSAL